MSDATESVITKTDNDTSTTPSGGTGTTAAGSNITLISKARSDQRRRFSYLTEFGSSGIRRFGGTVDEEFLLTLRGKRGARVFREMRDNDAVCGASIFAIEQIVRQASWYVEAQEQNTLHQEAANLLSTSMNDMSHSWNDFIMETLTFLTYGWSWLEMCFKLRKGSNKDPRLNSKYDDGFISWRKIPLRMQTTLNEWEFDDEGGVHYMIQQAPPDYKIREIPIEKSLLFRTRSEGNNPEGRSLLRPSYRSWFIKKNIEEFEAIGIENDLVGVPKLIPPEGFDLEADENLEAVASLTRLLGNLRRGSQEAILLPFGWDLSLLAIGTSRRQFDVDKVINRYDKRIALSVLAQFIMLGMDKVGSFALSETQNDIFLLAVQGFVDHISDILNRYAIPTLFKLNPKFAGLDGKYPVLIPGKVTNPRLKELGTFLKDIGGPAVFGNDEALANELLRISGLHEAHKSRTGVILEGTEKAKPNFSIATDKAAAASANKKTASVPAKPKNKTKPKPKSKSKPKT